MPFSSHIKLTETRAMIRLIGECCELGDDPFVWRTHFCAGLGKLVGAELVLTAETPGCRSGRLWVPGGTVWGLENGFSTVGYREMGEQLASNPFHSKLFRELVTSVRSKQGGTVFPRQQILPERNWDRSFDRHEIAERLGVGSGLLHSLQPVDWQKDVYDTIALCRAPGRPTFNEHEVALVTLVHQEIARFVGARLACWGENAPSQLPRRVRQVLRCLLEGDGDKQIASRLNLSSYTVNQYTKQIYAHFQVQSRGELLARWVRSAWGRRSDWDLGATAPHLVVPFDEQRRRRMAESEC